MRTTMNLNDDLVAKARAATGIAQKTALVHAGLRALLANEAAQFLAGLAGAAPGFNAAPRKRPWAATGAGHAKIQASPTGPGRKRIKRRRAA